MKSFRSARMRLALSYAGIVVVAGALLLAVVWLFLLRYVPDSQNLGSHNGFVPNRGDLERAFWPRARWVFGFLVLFGIVGGWFLAGRMLAPLRRITEATRHAATGSLSHRIRMTGRDDEFRELADAFDRMLARIEAHVGEQRRFAANASHELRTPLAIMRSLLDVARDDPEADVRATLDRVAATNARAIALTEALLTLASAERSEVRQPVDLSLALEEASEDLLPLAERSGIALDVTGDESVAIGDPTLLGQLAAILLHNAIVHNVAGGWVRASAQRRAVDTILTVENGGAVIDEATLATLAEPFQRGHARTRIDEHTGAGLGLSLAVTIVDAHGGSLALHARPGGGLRVEARVPAVR